MGTDTIGSPDNEFAIKDPSEIITNGDDEMIITSGGIVE